MGHRHWQADASRRRNGPRKATSCRPITVRLRSKSCPAGRPDAARAGRRAVVAQRPRTSQQADVGSKTRSAGRVPPYPNPESGQKEVPVMDIVFKGRHTDVLERFRSHATAKLAKIERLDSRAIRIDVEVSTERNPRQAGRRERVELTICLPGPGDPGRGRRRGPVHGAGPGPRQARVPAPPGRRPAQVPARRARRASRARPRAGRPDLDEAGPPGGDECAGERPAEVTDPRRTTMTLDRDPDGGRWPARRPAEVARRPADDDRPGAVRDGAGRARLLPVPRHRERAPSVVYRRRGYQYGVIRLVEDAPAANGRSRPRRTGPGRRTAPAPRPPYPVILNPRTVPGVQRPETAVGAAAQAGRRAVGRGELSNAPVSRCRAEQRHGPGPPALRLRSPRGSVRV